MFFYLFLRKKNCMIKGDLMMKWEKYEKIWNITRGRAFNFNEFSVICSCGRVFQLWIATPIWIINNNKISKTMLLFFFIHLASLILTKNIRQTIRMLVIKLFIDKSTLLIITTCVTIMLARVVFLTNRQIFIK